MSPDEVKAQALEFAKRHKAEISNELTDSAKFIPDDNPISVFMAGSPGAGKTEFSKQLLSILEAGSKHRVVRIDGDDLRKRIPGYTGSNSHLFQGAISIVVEKIHDLVLKKSQSFILDGTFSKYEKAADNIRRSLAKNRRVFIFYVYQTPRTAWHFTEAREQLEGRHIPKMAFIDEFCGAKTTVERIHTVFIETAAIFLVKKDFATSATREVVQMVKPNALIDEYIGEHYTKEDLEKML